MKRIFRIGLFVVAFCMGTVHAPVQAAAPLGPTFEGDELIVELEAPFTSHALAGNGRYLVAHLKSVKKVVLLDLMSGELVREIGSMPDDVLLAGSREYLILVMPGQRLIQRWSLKTLKRDKVGRFTADSVIKKAVLGHNAVEAGPLLLAGTDAQLIDLRTLRRIPVKGKVIGGGGRRDYSIRVSADGKTFGGIVKGIGPVGFARMRVDDDLTETGGFGSTSNFIRYAQPSADGALLFLRGATIYDGRALKLLPTDALKGRSCRPTTDPRYFLAIRFIKKDKDQWLTDVAICTTGELRTIYSARGFAEMAPRGHTNERSRYATPLNEGADAWIYLPSQNLFVTLGINHQRVYLRRFNLEKLIAAWEPDYLWVVSKPQPVALVDKTYRYAIETLSSSKTLKFKIEAGPEAMAVSNLGVVTWQPDRRPVGGQVEVIVSVTDGSGMDSFHAFTIDVERPTSTVVARISGNERIGGAPIGEAPTSTPKTAPSPKRRGAGRFVKVDDKRIEAPASTVKIAAGLNRRWLILSGTQLAVVAPDGFTIERNLTLQKEYIAIAERANYYVAIASNPNSVDVIDKKTLKILRARRLPYMELTDLALHPTQPWSYVALKKGVAPPRYGFIVFDETTAEGREGKDLIGKWLLVEPGGRWLIAGYHDFYQSGSELIANPTRWHIVPSYGNLDWLIRYDIGRDGVPVFAQLKQDTGGNGNGIRMSADGKRVTYLSHVGYPGSRGNLAGWDPTDLDKLPVIYDTKGRSSCKELAFHPVLPWVASPGKGTAVFFHRETGELLQNRLKLDAGALASVEIHRLYFSPDGRSLVFDTSINEIHYLYRAALRLSSAELQQIKQGLKRKAVRAPSAIRVRLKDIDALNKAAADERMTPKEIGRRYMNAVVLIDGGRGTGTGFVVGRGGYVMTCAHVLTVAGDPSVTFKNADGTSTKVAAQVVAVDDVRDLALLKLESDAPLTSVSLGRGGGVEAGEAVTVIGNPGVGATILDHTMTTGVVSNPARTFEDQTYIQTSAAINPGSSGGPMFDSRGSVIGLVVLKANIEGAGFAVPADQIRSFLRRVVEGHSSAAPPPTQVAPPPPEVRAAAPRTRTAVESSEDFSDKQIIAQRRRAVAWVRTNNTFGRKHRIVDDMEREIVKKMDAGHNFHIKLGKGLLRSGRSTFISVYNGQFFVHPLTQQQAGILALAKLTIVTVQSNVRQAAQGPYVRLSRIKFDDADKLGAAGEIKGRLSYRKTRSMSQSNYAIRMVMTIGEDTHRLYHKLGNSIKASSSIAFSITTPTVATPTVTVVYIELGTFRSEDHFVPLSKPIAQLVVLVPKED